MHTYWKDPEEMWGMIMKQKEELPELIPCVGEREASQQGTMAVEQSRDGIPIVQKLIQRLLIQREREIS